MQYLGDNILLITALSGGLGEEFRPSQGRRQQNVVSSGDIPARWLRGESHHRLAPRRQLWNGICDDVCVASPETEPVRSDRLMLMPLRVSDALEMVEVLSDSGLYEYTGGSPPDLEELQSRYSYQIAGPPSGRQVWHNWILRLVESDVAMGFVQATVEDGSADVAWLVAIEWQGRGFGTEAATAMCTWLAERGVEKFTAHIHPNHEASARVAARVGLRPTGTIDSEGEGIWSSTSK